MKILQQKVKLKRGERVQVNFSRPATVFIMTEPNFKRYIEGASFRRIGGPYEKSPVELTAPYDGLWHAVIEKGGYANPKPMTASIQILAPEKKEVTYIKENLIPEAKKDNKKKSAPEITSDEDENEDK